MIRATIYSFFCDRLEGKVRCSKTAGVYFMIIKVPALREEIGDPLDICMVLTVIIHPPSHFLERVERRLLLRGGEGL